MAPAAAGSQLESKVSDTKKVVTEIKRIELDLGSLHDFELLDGSVVRLCYDGHGQWTNPATGETFSREPQHHNCTAVV